MLLNVDFLEAVLEINLGKARATFTLSGAVNFFLIRIVFFKAIRDRTRINLLYNKWACFKYKSNVSYSELFDVNVGSNLL